MLAVLVIILTTIISWSTYILPVIKGKRLLWCIVRAEKFTIFVSHPIFCFMFYMICLLGRILANYYESN